MDGGQMESQGVGWKTMDVVVVPVGQGRRTGAVKDQPGGWRV